MTIAYFCFFLNMLHLKQEWEKKDVFSRFETSKKRWEALYKKVYTIGDSPL